MKASTAFGCLALLGRPATPPLGSVPVSLQFHDSRPSVTSGRMPAGGKAVGGLVPHKRRQARFAFSFQISL